MCATVVKVGMLGTLTSKFEFQKQTLAALQTTGATAAVASKFSDLLAGKKSS